MGEGDHVLLSVTEDNIPDEAKRARSDEFWHGILATIKTWSSPAAEAQRVVSNRGN